MAFRGTDRDYDAFMGRFSRRLAPLFADFAGVRAGMDVVDVGCGPGALTGELVARVGEDHVSGADPTEHFVASTQARFPGAEVVRARAESLPFADARFDAALAQLVLSFMEDPDAGIAEMRRVVRPGATVALCMWLGDGEMELLAAANGAARSVAPDHPVNTRVLGYRRAEEGRALCERAGLADVELTVLEVTAGYDGFEDLAAPILAGIGPLAEVTSSFDDAGRERYRAALRDAVGDPPGAFSLTGRAWAARGRVA